MSRSTTWRRAAAVALLPVVASLSGCLGWEEHMCNDGEYPTWRPDGPGATCFADSEQPTQGYVRYPAGDVPDLVDDDYRPPKRYPQLEPWVTEYVAWQDAGAEGSPPGMPPVG